MKKGNVIDLDSYRHRQEADRAAKTANAANISPELKSAIEILIKRLKDTGPILKSS